CISCLYARLSDGDSSLVTCNLINDVGVVCLLGFDEQSHSKNPCPKSKPEDAFVCPPYSLIRRFHDSKSSIYETFGLPTSIGSPLRKPRLGVQTRYTCDVSKMHNTRPSLLSNSPTCAR